MSLTVDNVILQTFADLKKRPLVSIDPTTTIEEAILIMKENHIQTVAINSSSIPGHFQTIVSFFDIVNFIVVHSPVLSMIDLSHTIDQILTLDSTRESYRIFELDVRDSLKQVLDVFSKGLHRILVTDVTSTIPAFILTQTDILKYIKTNIKSIPISFKASLKSLGIFTSQTIILEQHQTALDGFIKMRENRVIVIPILDTKGKLVSAISASSLRGLDRTVIQDLSMDAEEFAKKYASESIVKVDPDISFVELLFILEERHLHRVFITAPDDEFLGLVTLTDVISLVNKCVA